ncbi:Dienelactone hydrolase-like enzyme OS=Singulisphaera acidiphila (strain ATCC BAA-1392 / DSM 18658 / VKM B-2454 / MOB10) GN=Sinac_1537 PE=4 SV=1: Abhydrolase_5 [Gemmataceae bacterium]|nr:Dienelactone hydrolase-like enzyme OS=Singulisphaera acidiphila (strain ATCC BAA-1392 / DSM 18658 / VKM B-2454 / MOB10) GN=Sinac_1537 PE=4 SV=1: Abhydrolase_5 [Gemmataceae bacterium]VTU02318.1 Dienelactone hydrolase-like enzyme OS=Singulisphaera acidiphila (strain ATCC BAA-1392 / DSM 18658 / VKM B-2454 / MOB10) GN=Sinac_1537 PE=4 SV=1: Abhydrolase_5 [Gemmataceae bacterium]
MILRASLVLTALCLPGALRAADATPEIGTFTFDCPTDEKDGVAERFRIPACAFDYKLSLRHDLKATGVKVYDLTFPSPVKTAVPENNTVHCELFLPAGGGKGPIPAAVVLDILQGNALIARGQCMWLAQHGVAGMVVYMAHYGPRRPPGSANRLISTNVTKSVEGVKQTVLDVRCAVAWLASRPAQFDAKNLGLVGTSLGSLVGAVVAANEPRLTNVCLLLPGGGLVDAYYNHPKAEPYRPLVDLLGGKFTLKLLIGPVDPITYAKQLKGKNLLMLCASRDDIVPPAAAKALWAATGKQKIVWYDATHVGVAWFLMPVLTEMTAHVRGK